MHRLATDADIPALTELIAVSIRELQADVLSEEQILASTSFMGLDTQLIRDKTYFVVLKDNQIVGCGGWSWRASPYGGDGSEAPRDLTALDPHRDAARIRAMYTHPGFARQGIGRSILTLCEKAALAAGFRCVELTATLAGERLYRSQGYAEMERIELRHGETSVSIIRMIKKLAPNDRLTNREPLIEE